LYPPLPGKQLKKVPLLNRKKRANKTPWVFALTNVSQSSIPCEKKFPTGGIFFLAVRLTIARKQLIRLNFYIHKKNCLSLHGFCSFPGFLKHFLNFISISKS
jgi:hypothetical protein